MFGRATIRLGIGPHSSFQLISGSTIFSRVTLGLARFSGSQLSDQLIHCTTAAYLMSSMKKSVQFLP